MNAVTSPAAAARPPPQRFFSPSLVNARITLVQRSCQRPSVLSSISPAFSRARAGPGRAFDRPENVHFPHLSGRLAQIPNRLDTVHLNRVHYHCRTSQPPWR